MTSKKLVALKANVEVSLSEDNPEGEVAFYVFSPDGSSLTGNQIIEAIAEAVLLYWSNCPLEAIKDTDYDA